MKKKNVLLLAGIASLLVCAVVLAVIFIPKIGNIKDKPVITDAENTVSETDINVPDITSSEDNASALPDSDNYISPDETEADKILNSNLQDNSTQKPTVSKPAETNNVQALPDEEDAVVVSFEEGKKKLKEAAEKYMREHNIDPKTAGETGELCPNCGKKIWNMDKYGDNIPGLPEDYEHSGYCLGTCGITLE